MQKSQKKFRLFGGIAVVAFGLAMFFAVFGLSNTVKDVKNATVSHEASAILASAGMADKEIVSLPVTYYDQQSDECVNIYDSGVAVEARQFEWWDCGYFGDKLERGLVEFELGEDYLPVATGGGKMLTNRGVTKESFERWFKEVEGASSEYAGVLEMEYRENGAEFAFYQEDFYPLNNLESKRNDAVNNDGRNHLFTMNFAVPFVVLADGGERFWVEADDDTFVFVGNKLVLDMGGIHGAINAGFEIRDGGEIYASVNGEDMAYSGVKVTKGENVVLRIFHADRNSASSVFNVRFSKMNLAVESVKLAKGNEEKQVAYEQTDSAYVAPLGETKTVMPSKAGDYVVMVTVEGVLVVIFAILMAMGIRFVIHRK